MTTSPLAREPGPAERSDRRTRAKERRRDALYRAAVELFIERGYDNTTMDDISDRADVARTTVFNYFPRKADFLVEWAARRRARAAAALQAEQLTDAPLQTVLTRYLTEMSKLNVASRPETVAIVNAAVHLTNVLRRSGLDAELGALVARARDAGEINPGTDPERVGRLLAANHFSTLTAWTEDDPAPFDLTEEVVASLNVLLEGVLPR